MSSDDFSDAVKAIDKIKYGTVDLPENEFDNPQVCIPEAEYKKLREQLRIAKALDRDDIKMICHAWNEFNSIRARDGAPEHVSKDWWHEATERLKKIVEKITGVHAHCNPLLYESFETTFEAKNEK